MSFSELFRASKGQPIIYKNKELKLADNILLSDELIKLRLTFIKTDSKYKQGIVLQTKGTFEVNNMTGASRIVFWEDTAPKEIDMVIRSKDKVLVVYNVWENSHGTMDYWVNGAAMYVEQTRRGTIYHCNDGFRDEDMDDLIFKIQYL